MQTFLCLLGRGIFEGPGFKPGGLRAPAGQGLDLGFRHTINTQACVHACLVCASHTHPSPGHAGPSPTTHISCCAPGGCSRLSHLVSVHICLSHAALLPPTQGHPRAPPRSFPCPQPRGALPSGACEYAMGVPGCTMASVCAVACPFLGLASAPVWGLLCEACVLTLSYVHSCTYTWPYVHSLARLPGHVGILADVNVNKLYIYIANQSVTSFSH